MTEPSTLLGLARLRAQEKPDLKGYTFLVDGEIKRVSLTYSQLDRRARAIAAWLQSKGLEGDRILLLFPTGLQYIEVLFGCLYAGVVAIPAYPPQVTSAVSRLQAIIQDSGSRVALTTSPVLTIIRSLKVQAPPAMQWLVLDDGEPSAEVSWREPALDGNSLALIQYTSGTTGAPRGVTLSHGNIIHNLALLLEGGRGVPPETTIAPPVQVSSERMAGVHWLPPYHDLGLIGGILLPVYSSSPVVLMSPIAFLEQPVRWLQAISRYRAAYSGAPDFAYDWCVSRIPPEQRAGLDLSCWRLALCGGGGTIRHEALDRFAEAFAGCGFRSEAFYPAYGLAEATLFVSGRLEPSAPVVKTFKREALERNQVVEVCRESRGGRTLVGCGRIVSDQKLVIVNLAAKVRCSPDEVGEIWLSGPSVGNGYWGRTAEKKEIFNGWLADTGDGPFLRTGDLGFMKDGELFITGRLNGVIVVDDRVHYAEDIEFTAEKCHPALRPYSGAAFQVNASGARHLVIVHEVERNYSFELNSVIEKIRRAVAETHSLQVDAVSLIRPGSIFRTSSGKIQRYACREAFEAHKLRSVAEFIVR